MSRCSLHTSCRHLNREEPSHFHVLYAAVFLCIFLCFPWSADKTAYASAYVTNVIYRCLSWFVLLISLAPCSVLSVKYTGQLQVTESSMLKVQILQPAHCMSKIGPKILSTLFAFVGGSRLEFESWRLPSRSKLAARLRVSGPPAVASVLRPAGLHFVPRPGLLMQDMRLLPLSCQSAQTQQSLVLGKSVVARSRKISEFGKPAEPAGCITFQLSRVGSVSTQMQLQKSWGGVAPGDKRCLCVSRGGIERRRAQEPTTIFGCRKGCSIMRSSIVRC